MARFNLNFPLHKPKCAVNGVLLFSSLMNTLNKALKYPWTTLE